MAKWGKAEYWEIKRFQEELNSLNFDREEFCRKMAKELAARFLRGVIQRTPVGQYEEESRKKGGTLRRGWTASDSRQALYNAVFDAKDNSSAFLKNLEIEKKGDAYTVTISNPVEYASYVEYGHRTRGGKGWVPGKFMMTVTENEIRAKSPAILQKRLEQKLREVLK